MKKITSIVMAIAMLLSLCLTGCGAADDGVITVGVCQLMVHDSLDQATQGFVDALNEAAAAAGKTVEIDVQVAGEDNLCPTVINTFTAKQVDLIMANATPALLAAANATTSIPVLGTSVTDYNDTFGGNIPANVSGTSDAVPFDEQAKMMIETLGLKSGDQVGVLYCTNESNSKIQYEAVKALFEAKGRKYMITSGMTGYVPNKSDSAVADGWKDVFVSMGNPHVDDDTNASFNSQISKIFKVESKRDCFIAMADRWLPGYHVDSRIADLFTRVIASTYAPEKYQATDAERREMYAGNVLETAETRIADYVWLPIEWEGDQPVIRWQKMWRV